jgi:hypothetical protein
MFAPDPEGVVKVEGANVGGHAILAIGVDLITEKIVLQNSWGLDYGAAGRCFITFKDMQRLLNEDGEACVAIGKHGFRV